jgi:predicted molibdopterin-dependent oxidoreductase YjgC
LRVKDHPILGKNKPGKKVMIRVDGRPIQAYEGEPIAAALMAIGVKVFRKTRKKKQPRGVFCAIGRCTDCIMSVDGIPNVRTCITPVREGMEIWAERS